MIFLEYYLDGSLSGDLDLNYIQNLEVTMRSYGIVVPLTFNDVSFASSQQGGKADKKERTLKAIIWSRAKAR